MGQEQFAHIVNHFFPQARVVSIAALGQGNINDTYLVRSHNHQPLVLQRINPTVFPDPELVADNVFTVAQYIKQNHDENATGLQCLTVYPGRDGRSCYRDSDKQVWRLSRYLEDSQDPYLIPTAIRALEGGRALGLFHQQVADLDPSLLREPIPGFHNLARYRDDCLAAIESSEAPDEPQLRYCLDQAQARLTDAEILLHARAEKLLQSRVIHGDPKLDNVLFGRQTGRAMAMIDLDTVSEGLRLYDLGDCLRSFCNQAGEHPPDPLMVDFDVATCQRVLQGYRASGISLEEREITLLYQAVRLMTYELGLRLLTDYLVGNRYFKISSERDNLDKARVQFHLLCSIEQKKTTIEQVITAVFSPSP